MDSGSLIISVKFRFSNFNRTKFPTDSGMVWMPAPHRTKIRICSSFIKRSLLIDLKFLLYKIRRLLMLFCSFTEGISSTELLITKRRRFGSASLFSAFQNKEWSLVKYCPSDLNRSCIVEIPLSTNSGFRCRRFLLISSW